MRIFACLAVIVVFSVMPFPASQARVDVYRCVLDSGHISYQQIPCSSESKPMNLKDRRSGWSSLRPGERALLKSYREKEATRRRKPAGLQKLPVEDSKACWNKRKQLEAIRSKLRRGYQLNEADELHRKRGNYEDYLRQFCP
ncbi:MAG: hypothetical protein ACE5FQ_14625 [Thiogranum sp.]